MKVRRKSLWRSTNAKRAKKFAAMRAAKERKRMERAFAVAENPFVLAPRIPSRREPPLFVVTVRCRDGEKVTMRIRETCFGALSLSATDAGRTVSAILKNYRPRKTP